MLIKISFSDLWMIIVHARYVSEFEIVYETICALSWRKFEKSMRALYA